MCVRKKSLKKLISFCTSLSFIFSEEPTIVFNFFSSLSRRMSFNLLLATLSLTFFNLASKSVFVFKLVISGILFSTAVNAEAVAEPLISGILFSTSGNSVLLAEPLISESFFLTLSMYSSCSVIK